MSNRRAFHHGAWLAILAGLAWSTTAARSEHKFAPVPPTLEIEVLDPNADPRGNPAVVTRPGPFGNLEIDIPPVVIVHRYYYTGNRTFQAGFLPGGPSVVVVNHPKTGERLYIPVQMIPGAPRVTYTSSSIEYDYGNQGITITFCWLTGKPKVEYRNGPRIGSNIVKGAEKVYDAAKNLVARTGVPEACDSAQAGTKNIATTLADHLGTACKYVTTPFVQAAQYIPGINLLRSSPEDSAATLRDAEVRRAQAEAERRGVFIPTNR